MEAAGQQRQEGVVAMKQQEVVACQVLAVTVAQLARLALLAQLEKTAVPAAREPWALAERARPAQGGQGVMVARLSLLPTGEAREQPLVEKVEAEQDN